MKIKYYIKSEGGGDYPWVKSDFVVNDLDLIELLLSSDLSLMKKVDEFEKTVFVENNIWWFNATKVESSGRDFLISAAFDITTNKVIDGSTLKKIISHWKDFLVTKKEFVCNY